MTPYIRHSTKCDRKELIQLISKTHGLRYLDDYKELLYNSAFDNVILVLTDGKKILATAMIMLNEVFYSLHTINWVATKKSERGKGYATMLMKHIHENFREWFEQGKSATQILLVCKTELVKFYTNFGYRKLISLSDGYQLLIKKFNKL